MGLIPPLNNVQKNCGSCEGGSKYYNACYGLKQGKLFQLEKIINVYPHPKNTKLPGDAVGGSEGLNGKRLLKGPYWNTTATAGILLL